MKIKDFNNLKKEVREGNIEGLKGAIQDLTLKQAQSLENLIYDTIPLNDDSNVILDEIVNHIINLTEGKKVANKKAPAKKEPAKKEEKKENKEPEETIKLSKAEKTKNLFNKVNVGDIIKVQVEDELVKHDIKIIYKGKNNIIAILKYDEREVFSIRKTDFNKQMFEWTDRHGETYNIIVTLR